MSISSMRRWCSGLKAKVGTRVFMAGPICGARRSARLSQRSGKTGDRRERSRLVIVIACEQRDEPAHGESPRVALPVTSLAGQAS
jgi:hypothetical protein